MPTGWDDLDDLMDGGWWRGDNVLWVCPGGAVFDHVRNAFLSASGRPGRHLCVTSAACAHDLPPGTERVVVDPLLGVDVVVAAVLEPGSGDAPDERVDVAGLETMVANWGAAAAVEAYRRTCPQLFARGAVAYWQVDRDLGPVVIDAVRRIAQCLVDLRGDRLRIVKAEGRPRRLTGLTVPVRWSDGVPSLGRSHVQGRLGAALQRVRRERDLTQAQLAALAGVTPAAISQAEVGHRGLSLDTVVRLCEHLAIGVDDLLETSRPPEPLLARFDAAGTSAPGAGAIVPLLTDAAIAPRTHLIRLAPNESSPPPFVHKGPELILAASGLVHVDLGDSSPVLRAGDALRVVQSHVRDIANLAATESTVFWQALPAGVGVGADRVSG